ncbi:MAG: DNA polymerase III subunit alpha [Ignavibacteriales bacterium]|nr:DNA polymerase III subunit alpha [Ignavibacteriales bacterium]
MSDFIHLHNHSHFSLLDGAASVDGLVNASVANGMTAVALTDHGVMFGAIEFYKKAKKAGIKPILGCEMYIVTKGSRFDKDINQTKLKQGQGRGIYYHVVLLAKNYDGYKNLIQLCTLGHTEGFYYKPRIDLDLLKKYSKNLIALSACPNGVVAHELVEGNFAGAKETASEFVDIFGNDFYLELQNHGLEKEKPILEGMPKLAKEFGVSLVATNDVHYIKQEHALAHNVLLMIPDASQSNPTDYHQLRYQTDQLYFKSPEEMRRAFKEFPQAISSTLEIAEMIEQFSLEPEKPYMPEFPIPPDAGTNNLNEYLNRLAYRGLEKRFKEITPELKTRIEHELSVINKMGYAGYFLITQDFINAAREMDILVGPGRGSAAGSLVSYCLGITNVDPLKYDLLFERFLNPDRVSMPDIDIDFSDSKRDKVIEYVRNKYGKDSVSQIITFGTLSTRAVLKDVARVIGVPLNIVESITKQIPVIQGRVTPLQEAIDTNPELKWIKESPDEKIHELINISLVLEGFNRNASTHAAGVVIAPGPLIDYVPLYKTPQTEIMTQYNMIDLEKAGLLKMDFLGLRTLTVVENALHLINLNHGIKIDLDTIPENDPETFDVFGRGQTVGVFQFESSGMQDWLRKLKPTSISDIVAMNALYRPGPMEMIGDFIRRKQGANIDYPNKALEPILRETYGIIVYQEQVIRIASEIAGFTLAKADLMRRAMGKKDKELMAKQKKEFIDGAVQKGFSKKVGSDIFDMIEKFASYGFNKSHSVAYSVLAYQTAFLKAHYPSEFMAATMSAEIGDTDYVVQLIEECRRMKIHVLPPDVNESGVQFIVTSKGIRFGMSAIKNVGVSAVEIILKSRQEQGNFENIFDFCRRVDLRLVNKKTVEGLIQSGAFDSLHPVRTQVFDAIELSIQYGQNYKEQSAKGQSSLFESGSVQKRQEHFPSLPSKAEWNESEKLSREKSVLGFYVSGHPLRKYEMDIKAFATAQFGAGIVIKQGTTVRVAGIISALKKKVDKKGNMMAFLTLEDFIGKGECIVFSEAYRNYSQLLIEDAMVMIIGTGEQNGDSLRIFVKEVIPIEKIREKYAKQVVISIKLDETTESSISSLKQIVENNKGKYPCYFNVININGERSQLYQSTKLNVNISNDFISAIEQLLGPSSVRISS